MKRTIDIIALIIVIAGAISCGLIGIFEFNVISWLFGEQPVAASSIIYSIVAIAGIWCINLIMIQGQKRTDSHGKPT